MLHPPLSKTFKLSTSGDALPVAAIRGHLSSRSFRSGFSLAAVHRHVYTSGGAGMVYAVVLFHCSYGTLRGNVVHSERALHR